MNDFIENIYKTRRVQDESGNEYKLHSEVDRFEGELLHLKGGGKVRQVAEENCDTWFIGI
jgi:hypothetical protein